jgi:hypothetical protein
MQNDAQGDEDPRRLVADRMAAAAGEWLATLGAQQRTAAHWAAPGRDRDSDSERLRWFYTPTDHGGLTMGEQRPGQQRRAMQLVASGLSTAGYVTVSTIMGWENVLDLVEGFTATWARERGRDPGMYYLRVFGDPVADRVWAWRFGGHHVSLNNLVIDGRVHAVTPCFLGLDPASAEGLGQVSLRPLGAVEDLARDLLHSLGPDLSAKATLLDRAPADIVGGNRARIGDGDQMISLPDVWRGHFSDPEVASRLGALSTAAERASGVTADEHRRLALTRSPKGVPGGSLDRAQRDRLGALLRTYTGRVPDGLAPAVDLDEVHFAWAGSTEPGEPHYYRLQAPRLLMEWDNTQRNANHGHSVWRDPQTDFGLDVLGAHRARHHMD